MTKLVSRTEIARRAGVTPSRINQWVADGVIEQIGKAFDPVDSLSRILQWYRRDEGGKAVRDRHRMGQAIALETRTRRELRHLLSIDEVSEITTALFNGLHAFVEAEASRYHSKIMAEENDAMKARVLAHRFRQPMLSVALAFRDGSAQLLVEIQRNNMPNDGRLDALVAAMRQSIEKTLTDEMENSDANA